jgi:glutaredoxin 3
MADGKGTVLIYTAPACAYCVRAKLLLRERGIPFQEVDVAHDSAARSAMIQVSGRRTVPQILVGGVYIGGYEELAALDRRGELIARIGAGLES